MIVAKLGTPLEVISHKVVLQQEHGFILRHHVDDASGAQHAAAPWRGALHDEAVADGSADFELSLDELRTVARFAAEAALEALPLFERAAPSDPRPRAAIDAAYVFADGADRTTRQRVAAVEAHRAAAEAPDLISRLAAGAAGDAAAAAYLHPIAKATQVGHILRAAARAAHAAELEAGDDREAAAAVLEQARRRATPELLRVLRRYPALPAGKGRTAQLMYSLDTTLRGPQFTSRSRGTRPA